MTSAEAATTRPDLPHLSLPRRRARSTGFWVSLAVHAALLALVWTRHDLLIPTARPGDPRFGDLGDGGGGGGGGGPEATYIIALPPVPPPTPAATTPVPPPVVTPPRTETPVPQPVPPAVVAQDTVPAAQTASATPGAGAGGAKGIGPGSGGGSGGGQGGGVGPGAGPGTGSGGEGGSIRPPELRGLAIPFSTPPRELRGKTVKVTFAITTDGRVERFETDPVITNRGYYRKFAEIVLGFRFRPARGPDGQPVAVVFPMEFTLPTQ